MPFVYVERSFTLKKNPLINGVVKIKIGHNPGKLNSNNFLKVQLKY